jgi:lipopolysaccharide heptosyltransferase II
MFRTFPNKTVVFRLSSIGDVILSSPLLRVLRAAAGPKARIDFVVKKKYAELVRYNHHLSVVYELDEAAGYEGLSKLRDEIKAEGYDLIVDIHDNIRTKFLRNFSSAKEVVTVDKRLYERWQLVNLKRNIYRGITHVVDRYIETVKAFGIVNDKKGLEIFIPDEVQFGISGKIAKLRLNQFDKVIGLCPGSKHFTKRWEKEKFAEVAVRLARDLRGKVLIFGGVEDKNDASQIASMINGKTSQSTATDFCGSLTLLETAAAMEYCDVMLTNDTGLMHLAAAKQRPVVAMFGSTVKEFGFFPYGTDSIVLENDDLRCRPCSHIGLDHCPKGHFRCMGEISVDQVEDAARQLL